MSPDNTPALPLPEWPKDDAIPADLRESALPLSRLSAGLFPWRYDRQLNAGVTPEPGSALAVHIGRLTSRPERERLAETLLRMRRDSAGEPLVFSSRIPVDQATVASAIGYLDEVAARLQGPRPVRAHGVARLRLLLSDGTGPVYQYGRGDLGAALREVLARL